MGSKPTKYFILTLSEVGTYVHACKWDEYECKWKQALDWYFTWAWGDLGIFKIQGETGPKASPPLSLVSFLCLRSSFLDDASHFYFSFWFLRFSVPSCKVSVSAFVFFLWMFLCLIKSISSELHFLSCLGSSSCLSLPSFTCLFLFWCICLWLTWGSMVVWPEQRYLWTTDSILYEPQLYSC